MLSFEGGFDSDTDDDELFIPDPDFDNRMVQAWNAAESNPKAFNELAGDLFSVYVLARSRWRKFTGRLPRRKRLARRKKFTTTPNLRDPHKANPTPKSFMCGECSSFIDINSNRLTPTKKHFW